jgi:hypothetical protein
MAGMHMVTMEEDDDDEEEDSKEEEKEEAVAGEGKEPGGGGGGKGQQGQGQKWAAREAAWKRELLVQRGPYLYELFAVLIHSGSALGAFLVLYIFVCPLLLSLTIFFEQK